MPLPPAPTRKAALLTTEAYKAFAPANRESDDMGGGESAVTTAAVAQPVVAAVVNPGSTAVSAALGSSMLTSAPAWAQSSR